jgi:homoserine acetyltransferase
VSRAICCLSILLLSATATAGDQQFADIGSLATASGEVVESCRVGYRTSGTLNADKSNVLVFPTWFGGTAEHLERFGKIGPGLLADTDRFYVIAIDALSNGVSCSPSNSRNADGGFPAIAIEDMVRSQHALLTKKLGIDHVAVVMGISMGGMQTFQWITQYPDFMDRAVAMDGAPWPTSFDLIEWQTHKDVVLTARAGGTSDTDIGRLISQVTLLTLFTPDYFVENVKPEAVPEFVEQMKSGRESFNPDDYVSQLDAMMTHNVLGDGDIAAYAERVKAEVLIVGVASDHMVNPQPGKTVAPAIGAEYLEVRNNCGHIGSGCAADIVNPRVANFLAN